MKHLFFALCFLFATDVIAQALPPQKVELTGQLSGIALNAAAAADRTVTVCPGRYYEKMRLGVSFTRVAATTVDAQFTCSYTGTRYYRRTTKSYASGQGTLNEETLSNPQTSSIDFEIEFDIRGCYCAKILLSGTSAGASDLVSTETVYIKGQ